jgi:DNA-binding NarL/FixJ family response regulator
LPEVLIDEERRYYVERCLRLEAEIARLSGIFVEELPPPCAKELPLAVTLAIVRGRRIHHAVTPDEIAQMRQLRRSGLSYNQIASRMGRAEQTARRYTMDVPC